jgi:predicted ester cyclase
MQTSILQDKKGEHRMPIEENKVIMRRMLDEVLVGGDLDLMDELVAPDFINHNVVGTSETSSSVGVENFRQEIRALRSAIPDIALKVIHLLADGDHVIAHLRGQGTHLGEFRGILATGNRVNVPSITIVRMANGKFAERWNLVDSYGLLQQLGVIPSEARSN